MGTLSVCIVAQAAAASLLTCRALPIRLFHNTLVAQAVEDQIRHFGQTPAQLFRRRHPRRGPPPPPTAAPLLNGPDAFRLTVVGRPPADRCADPLEG